MELKEEKKFESRYDGEAKETYDKIKKRPAFRYEAESDPAYRAYRDSYRREGELAMRSTQAEAADLTGGYGSSYAQRLGQQQYGEYLRKLSDVMPELYKDAYSRYVAEGEQLNARLNAAGKLAEADYGRYRNERYTHGWLYRGADALYGGLPHLLDPLHPVPLPAVRYLPRNGYVDAGSHHDARC